MIKMKYHELLSTVGGLGYFPKAPGTAGSLAGLVVCYLLRGNAAAYVLAFILVFITGVISSGKMEEYTKTTDPSCVVIDEFAGIFLVFFMIPMTGLSIFAGFLFFRLFDILKPPPIRTVEKIGGGWGIMLDDILAGIFAHILLRILLFQGRFSI
ncbi:MAG: phosphatidylglycerophosphatase A [Candidatus Omnitrophota bacterium]